MAQIFPNDDHDTVVRKFAELVGKNNPEKYEVQTASSSGRKTRFGGVLPDIVLLDAGSRKPVLAIEVETAGTLSRSQAEERWKPLAAKAPALQVVLPKGTLARAGRLSKKLGIKAKFQEY